MRPSFAPVLALTVLIGSCNLIDDLTTPVGYCSAQVKQFCRAQFQCCTDIERTKVFALFIILSGDPYSTEAECVESYTQVCEAYGASANQSVREGRMTFDQARATECVEQMRADVDACNPEGMLTRDEVCDQALAGAVDESDLCFNDNECADEGATCAIDEPDVQGDTVTITMEGKCKIPLGDGEACTAEEECQGYCSGAGEGACSNDSSYCEYDEDCVNDFCDGTNCYDSGDPCAVDADCNVGATCAISETGVCAGGGEGEGEGEGEVEMVYEFCDGLE